MGPRTLLDTDVLSGLMRKTPSVVGRARAYLADYGRLTISAITRFEILRGLKAKNATAQLTVFDTFCMNNDPRSPIKGKCVRRRLASTSP